MSNTQKLEYDSHLGGSVVLPNHVPTYRYAANALQEIKNLLDDVQQPKNGTKLIFQTLPKHMRRRAMSHHPKRLPRKYRVAHKAQMAKAGKPKQTKRPSRNYRRRPKNLMRAYLRRQRQHVWLETHLWYAKRFHMVNRWGYRLPYASCDKTYRACYRASAQHCLLQDISYNVCVELIGDVNLIAAGFARMTSAECSLSIAAQTYLSGRREGHIDLFRIDQYPLGALGRCSFMWQPVEVEKCSTERKLWLWLHPSGYDTTLSELITVFELHSKSVTKVPLVEELDDEPQPEEVLPTSIKAKTQVKSTLNVKKLRQLRFMTRTVPHECLRSYANESQTMTLNALKDKLNRFRLTGPLAQRVLAEAFKPYQLPCVDEIDTSANWFNASTDQSSHKIQALYWQRATQLRSPNELLSNMIIGLNVVDPRLQRPNKRTKAKMADDSFNDSDSAAIAHDLLMHIPSCLPHSVLWQPDVRQALTRQLLSTHNYCAQRARHAIVPGAHCRFEQALQPVPILLIQRPGSQNSSYKRLGYGCGWDVIAPSGYGIIIWLTFIMWGAKPGGLREFESIAREAGADQHLPDTIAARQQAEMTAAELQTKYFKMPPNRRCNYRKFAVVSPFRAPFAQLVRDWLPAEATSDTITTSFHVLRNRTLLQRIEVCVRQPRRLFFPSADELPNNCLIQIHLRLHTRGTVSPFALICLPTRADFKSQLKQYKNNMRAPVYTEPLLADPDTKTRLHLRIAHKRLLKRLRSRRVRQKRKQQQTATRRVRIQPANTAQLIAKQFQTMCNLWLPINAMESRFSVRKQATREVFGYVTNASFSFTEATVSALGYVTPEGLRSLLELCRTSSYIKQPTMCLLRDTQSRDYRFATFKINEAVSTPAY